MSLVLSTTLVTVGPGLKGSQGAALSEGSVQLSTSPRKCSTSNPACSVANQHYLTFVSWHDDAVGKVDVRVRPVREGVVEDTTEGSVGWRRGHGGLPAAVEEGNLAGTCLLPYLELAPYTLAGLSSSVPLEAPG